MANIPKQGVALKGRNSTGPPWNVGCTTARRQCYRRSRTDDDDRRQRAKQYWPIRRASNNAKAIPAICLADNSACKV